jgi:hypothetical protein
MTRYPEVEGERRIPKETYERIPFQSIRNMIVL